MTILLLRMSSLLATSVVAAAICATDGQAQTPRTRTISGRVVDDAGQVVPYASVATSSGSQTTTQPDGMFRLPLTAAPTITLVVRQIGFHPESLTVMINLSDTTSRDITVKLTRNPIHLSAVAVTALRTCSAADLGDSTARAQLQPLFDALQENVSRSLILLRAHPFRAQGSLTLYDSSDTGRSREKTFRGSGTYDGTWSPYRPGKVVPRSRRGRDLVAVSPGFYVDSVFKSRHCFRYGGEELINGQRAFRIDFAPNALVTDADWSGSVFLDAQSYVIRETRISLTYPPNTRGEQMYGNWSVLWEEIFPGLMDITSERKVTWTTDASRPSDQFKMSVIEMRTLKRTYIKDAPGQTNGERPER